MAVSPTAAGDRDVDRARLVGVRKRDGAGGDVLPGVHEHLHQVGVRSALA